MLHVEPSVQADRASVLREGREMGLFIARPAEQVAAGKRPGVLLIQEAFGVNAHIRDVATRFARLGYTVVAPDLYYRGGAWQEFSYDNIAAARPQMEGVTEEAVTADLDAALRFLAEQPDVDSSRVGVVGYCMGGRLSYHAATVFGDRLAAAAVYYGGRIVADQPAAGWPVAPVERTAQIRCPVRGFFGGQDASIPREHVERIEAALSKAGVEHDIYFYPEAGHGFFCDARASFHARSACDAWLKTVEFFRRRLG